MTASFSIPKKTRLQILFPQFRDIFRPCVLCIASAMPANAITLSLSCVNNSELYSEPTRCHISRNRCKLSQSLLSLGAALSPAMPKLGVSHIKSGLLTVVFVGYPLLISAIAH